MMDILADRPWARMLVGGLSLGALCLVAGEAVARYPPTYVLRSTAFWTRLRASSTPCPLAS
jgi:hypothetical protein